MSKKDKIKIFCLASILFLAILIPVLNKAIPYFRVVIAYEKAEELIAQENYSEAQKVLVSCCDYTDDYHIRHYKDRIELIFLCQSHIAYEQGDIEKAYEEFNLSDFNIFMEYQTEEQSRAIIEYCNKLETAYRPIAEEKARQEEEKKLKKIRSGVPYVGMLEIYISETSLGEPSPNVITGNLYDTGENYETRTYEYYEGERFIFSAKCARGVVISVWDRRDYPDPPQSTWEPETNSESDSDPYNASSYRNAERFYEANYGHFDSFEDAEYYYNRHKDD